MRTAITPVSHRMQILIGDITKLRVDAIVNAANPALSGGGGVDGAIHRAAGRELDLACRGLRGCGTGHVKLTSAFNLPCRYVLHAVGPVWQGGHAHEAKLLASCYREALHLAIAHHCSSIAFPAISTGAYGYPHVSAARVAVRTVFRYITRVRGIIVVFVVRTIQEADTYRRLIETYETGSPTQKRFN